MDRGLITVACPRCGKQLGVLPGSHAWCTCVPTKKGEKRKILMVPVEAACPLVKQDA